MFSQKTNAEYALLRSMIDMTRTRTGFTEEACFWKCVQLVVEFVNGPCDDRGLRAMVTGLLPEGHECLICMTRLAGFIGANIDVVSPIIQNEFGEPAPCGMYLSDTLTITSFICTDVHPWTIYSISLNDVLRVFDRLLHTAYVSLPVRPPQKTQE